MPSTSRHCFGKSSGRTTSTHGKQREDVSLRLETRNAKLETAPAMKLASLKRGGRDGTLVVVSRSQPSCRGASSCIEPASGARQLVNRSGATGVGLQSSQPRD